MRGVHSLLAIGSLCTALTGAHAQAPNLEPNHPDFKIVPTVTFERVYPNAEPSHYAIAVDSSGNAAYQSVAMGNVAGETNASQEPYILKFTVSEATCERIFELARQASYFKHPPERDERNIPNTGTLTLTYSEGPADSFGHVTNGARNSMTYGNSAAPAIRQLTRIFEGISGSLELGRQLESLHRAGRPGLDAALERAEERVRQHRYAELQAIAYCFQNIAGDPSVSGLARQRARRLLLIAQSSSAH